MSSELVLKIQDLIINGIIVLVMNLTHERRFGRALTYILELIWIFVFAYGVLLFPMLSQIKGVVGLALLAIMGLGLFKDRPARILFSLAIIMLMTISNEALGILIYFPNEIIMGNRYSLSLEELLPSMLVYMLSFAVMMCLLTVYLNRYRYRLGSMDMILIILFPVSQFMLIYGWLGAVRANLAENAPKLLLVFSACIAADIALFALIRRVSQRARLQAENRILAEQMEKQDEHYSELTAQFENIRRMRHDIANHLKAMESVLEAGDNSSAREYLAELKGSAGIFADKGEAGTENERGDDTLDK